MSYKCNTRLALLALGLAGMVLVAAHPAAAQTNLVKNAGFESPKTSTFTNNKITSWSGTSNASTAYGDFRPTAFANTFPKAQEGFQVGYVNTGDIFQNILGTTLTAGHTYTLSGYLGIRSDKTGSTGHIELETTGGTFLTGALSGLTSAPGTFTKYTYTFKPTGSSLYLGQGLTIDLGIDNPGTNRQVNFDSVRLTDASPAPEPAEAATLAMISLGLGGLLLRARKRKADATLA